MFTNLPLVTLYLQRKNVLQLTHSFRIFLFQDLYAYMYQIYLLRTTGNKEWWTSSCVFYCCVSRTQSDMLRIEKTKSDHTYQEEGRMRTMVYCYVHFVTLKIILRKAYHQKEQHIKSKEKCCHPLYLSPRKKSMQKIKDVVWQGDACLLPCMYLWSLRLV